MAIEGQFGDVGRAIINRLISGSIFIIGTLLLIGIIGGTLFFIFYLRKFNVKVRMKTRRGTGSGGEPIYKIYYDKGGILTKRKTKRNFFRVLRERVDLPSPPYEAFQITAKGGNEIEIIKESDKQYGYLTPGKIVWNDGNVTANQQYRAATAANDFWDDVRGREIRKTFDPEGLLWKLAPIALAVFMVMGVIFYTYIWLDKAPAIIGAAREVSAELAETARVLRDITTASAGW